MLLVCFTKDKRVGLWVFPNFASEFLKFNSFLGQLFFLELVEPSSSNLRVLCPHESSDATAKPPTSLPLEPDIVLSHFKSFSMSLLKFSHVDLDELFARNCNVVVRVGSTKQVIGSFAREVLPLPYEHLVDLISAKTVLSAVSVEEPLVLKTD